MYKVLSKNYDVDGNVFYLRQTCCFTLSEVKKFLKKFGRRNIHYIIEYNGKNCFERLPYCFSVKHCI